MPDQLRYNTGKLQLSYWLSTEASTFIYSGDSWDDDASPFALNETDKALRLEHSLGVFARGEDNEFLLLDETMECFGSRDALGEAFTRACMMGAAKYERGNYMLGAPISQYLDCAARHLKAIRLTGAWYTETFTDKNGVEVTQQLNHWDNVAWNHVMIFEVMDKAPSRDDRLFHCGDYAGNKPAVVRIPQDLCDAIDNALGEPTVPAFITVLAAAERLAEDAGDYGIEAPNAFQERAPDYYSGTEFRDGMFEVQVGKLPPTLR